MKLYTLNDSSTPVRMVKSGKMDFLTIRKLSDDEFSEADSMARYG